MFAKILTSVMLAKFRGVRWLFKSNELRHSAVPRGSIAPEKTVSLHEYFSRELVREAKKFFIARKIGDNWRFK